MSIFLLPISLNFFKKSVSIHFNNILDGFNNFLNFNLEGKPEQSFIDFIIKVFELNNCHCYIDLYLSKLSKEDKDRLIKLTPTEDKDMLLSILSLNYDTIYYEVTDKSILPFLVRLSTREIFFVTFYFVEKPITIWGNFNKNFPCFLSSKEELDLYTNLWSNF